MGRAEQAELLLHAKLAPHGKGKPGGLPQAIPPASPRLPVVDMLWQDVQDFVQVLNGREKMRNAGWVYRLPTEAEWEYACRGGPLSQKEGQKTAPFYFGKPSFILHARQANFKGDQPYGAAPRWPSVNGPAPCGLLSGQSPGSVRHAWQRLGMVPGCLSGESPCFPGRKLADKWRETPGGRAH